MLIMKIELWPQGNKKKSKLLCSMVIENDNTGSEEMGNYRYYYMPGKSIIVTNSGRIKNFPRIDKPALCLLYTILKKMFRKSSRSKSI